MAHASDIKQQGHNETLQQEKAKAEVSGQRQDERNRLDQQRHEQRREKSAIGNGDAGSRTGEPGSARNELDPIPKEASREGR